MSNTTTLYKEQNRIFQEMAPAKLFLRCALPNMISMAVVSLYTIADGIFVGHYIGAEALAAINLVMPLIMMSFALSDMVAVGSSVQIAIWLGKGDEKTAGSIFSSSCLFILLSAIIMGTAAYVFAWPLVHFLGASGDVASLAVRYMRIYAVFSIFIMHFFAVDNYLRICGKVHYSMAMNVGMALANIFLDWIFIGIMRWGIEAAALASCLSLMVGNFICFYPFFRGKLLLRFTKKLIPMKMVSNIIANGSSEFFNNISGSVCMMIFNAALMSYGNYLAVAAFSIIMYVDSVVKALMFGMADSLQPAISYNFGAENPSRVRAIEKIGQISAFLLSLLVFILMETLGDTLISWFSNGNTELTSMSVHGMRIFAFSYLLSWCPVLSGSFFTALNRPVFSLITASCNTLIFPVSSLLFLSEFLGLDGIWISSPTAAAGSFILSLIFLKNTYHQLNCRH